MAGEPPAGGVDDRDGDDPFDNEDMDQAPGQPALDSPQPAHAAAQQPIQPPAAVVPDEVEISCRGVPGVLVLRQPMHVLCKCCSCQQRVGPGGDAVMSPGQFEHHAGARALQLHVSAAPPAPSLLLATKPARILRSPCPPSLFPSLSGILAYPARHPGVACSQHPSPPTPHPFQAPQRPRSGARACGCTC
jgi:hypothetical protein